MVMNVDGKLMTMHTHSITLKERPSSTKCHELSHSPSLNGHAKLPNLLSDFRSNGMCVIPWGFEGEGVDEKRCVNR